MKKFFLLTVLMWACYASNAQIYLFHEMFEPPLYGDSVVSSQSGSTDDWGHSSMLHSQGVASDTCQVQSGDTTYLTSNTFSTTGSLVVYLEFDQICKIDFTDAAEIEVSTNNGATWTKLTASQYMGNGQFGTLGNKFTSVSYVNSWDPANANTVPTNSWWQSEKFDLSTIAANTSQVKVRFMLSDGGTPGAGGNYGWALDNIRVWIPSPQEASITGIQFPLALPSGCGLSNETIQIFISNNGSAVINGNMTASFQRNNGTIQEYSLLPT